MKPLNTIHKTVPATLEAISRVLFDHKTSANVALCDLSREIARALGIAVPL